jgi:adenylate kinase family enzyme
MTSTSEGADSTQGKLQPLTVLFYGPAGCGKGTQLALLKQYLETHDTSRKPLQVETGAAFRQFTEASGSYTGRLTKDIVERGEMPDPFISIWLWADALVQHYTGTEHLLFDGFPRRELEADVLDGAFRLYGRDRVVLFVLHVGTEKVIERLKKRKRSDDLSEDRIRNRLTWYEKEVVPTIEHYRQRGAPYEVVDIDGERAMEEVHAEIISTLGLKTSAA